MPARSVISPGKLKICLDSAAKASNSAARRALAATVKPRFASSSATARPMPELAPVTRATPSAERARVERRASGQTAISFLRGDKRVSFAEARSSIFEKAGDNRKLSSLSRVSVTGSAKTSSSSQ